MTLSLRSLSARRYRIEGDLPSVSDAEFSKKLAERAFRPLSEHEERTHGWTSADNCLDVRFDAASLARGPCAVFSLRIDKRRVSSRLLKARVDLEMRGRRKDAERDREGAALLVRADEKPGRPKSRLSRDERSEVRRQIAEELLRTTTPSMEVHPVLVYPRDRVVLFGALSRPANEVFRALFCDTFDVTLSASTPYHRALELLAAQGGGEALSGLRRTEFHAVPGSIARASAMPTGAGDVPESIAARSRVPERVPEHLSEESKR